FQCCFTTTARDQVLLATRAEVASYRDQESQWKALVKSAESKLNDWLAEQKQPHVAALRGAKIDALPISNGDKSLLKEQPGAEAAQRLAKQHDKELQISDDDFRRVFTEQQRQQWDTLKREIDSIKGSGLRRPPTALAIVDRATEPEP